MIMSLPKDVTVEFYGIPRQRAGRPELFVAAHTITELLGALERACPGLAGIMQQDGQLNPHYLLSINGEKFANDGGQSLVPGDRVLLFSADAGG
jgi:molybdopterin converting factor small subunit